MKHVSAVLAIMLAGFGCSKETASIINPLPIPQLIDTIENQDVTLELQKGEHEFYRGIKSKTMGINGDYLGPTIRLHKGTIAKLNFLNNIGEKTTIHGHGLHVSGDIDGGPQLAFNSKETWSINIPVNQEAGTSWYHPHFMGKTAEHVHAGLAGLYIIEDDNSKTLGLPNDYGVDDIPLIVQDRTFVNGKMKPYAISHDEMMDGLREDTLVVNGGINTFHHVPKGWIRLRLLNASNARFYRFHFENNESFYKVATEGGFLNKAVSLTELTMAPGERNEIMIDLSHLNEINLMAAFLPADPDEHFFFMDWFSSSHKVVNLKTDSSLVAKGLLPEQLNNIEPYSVSDIENATLRTFRLDMDDDKPIEDMHNMFSINGQSMKMNVINEKVRKGALEVWTITAEMMPHPFHIHGVSFQILSHQGKAPAEADVGWKDTVIVTEEPTKVIMRFNHEATEEYPYMYHCHILEHEDGGMMGQFTVQ